MADIQKLLKTILSDPKLAKSRNFAAKIYRDEPILITAAQLQSYTPPKYREMRKIARSSIPYDSDTKIFYEQGKFMEDFEDDFNYQGEFIRYYPTYQSMNDPQLRGYFSWRTRVKRGNIEKTSLSFVFVYLYELLNQIGVRSPEEGFSILKNFCLTYEKFDSRINSYARLWLKDYVIYYNLDKSLLEDFAETKFDHAVSILLHYSSHSTDDVFCALNSLSSYNLENSRFFRQHPDVVKQVVYDVFSAFSVHHDKNCKNSLCEKLFGRVYASPYSMFNAAVFYPQNPRQHFIYEISDICRYTCQNGHWSCERFFCYGSKNQQIGALLKTIDFHLRQKYHFKSTLKEAKTTKILQGLIHKAIDNYLENQRKAARPTIEIDVSRLQNIRDAALKTQRKLVIEEPDEEETQVSTAEQNESENDIGLNATEYLLISRLLCNKPYSDLLQSKGLMLSVLIDGINEKLFDRFGDTVIIDVGGKPETVEEYQDELKELIKA